MMNQISLLITACFSFLLITADIGQNKNQHLSRPSWTQQQSEGTLTDKSGQKEPTKSETNINQSQENNIDNQKKALSLLGEPLAVYVSAKGPENIDAFLQIPEIAKKIIVKEGAVFSPSMIEKIIQQYPKTQIAMKVMIKGDLAISEILKIIGKEDGRETKYFLTRERFTSSALLNTLPDGKKYGVPSISEKQEKDSDPVEWYKFKHLWFGTVGGKIKVITVLFNTDTWIKL